MAKKRNTLWPAATLPSVAVTFTVDEKGFAVIRPAKTRHGPRGSKGPIEWAQRAIQFLYGANPPKDIPRAKLVREVRAFLDRDPGWRALGLEPVSRSTVIRALETIKP
jgi:hypothetical protein